jgi:tRNA(Ile)-lysidine synthase
VLFPAQCPPAAFGEFRCHNESVIDRVVRTMERYRMTAPGMRLGVAISGGADSVCLLHVLLELAARWDLRLTVLHLNHHLRGAESDADAAFVRDLAARLGLPAILRDADLAAVRGNLEQAARSARFAFFRETTAAGSADRIALGHTASDQAETVLYRFLRGSGTAGLAGIRPATSAGIIRPLIAVHRAEVEQYLRDRGIAWREDSTNRSPQFARNRIRHQLLPQLARDSNPAIAQTLAHTADWALAEEEYWAAETDRLAAAHLVANGAAVLLRADVLASLPLAAGRRLARRALEQVRGDLRSVEFSHITAILELAGQPRGSGGCEAPGVRIRRSFHWLRFAPAEGGNRVPAPYTVPVSVPGIVRLPGAGLAMSMELIEKSETSDRSAYVYNEGIGCLDWCALSGPLEFRNWRPGDQYQPLGSACEQKIKTLFQEARVPSWERGFWPILTDGVSILWTRRFGAAARFAANTGSQVLLVIREIRV